MTGNLAIDLAISVAGILVLVAVSYFLGAMRSAEATQEAASERLAFDEPDFVAAEWFMGADRKAAAALSADAREIGLVFAVGDGLATRRVRPSSIAIENYETDVVFRLGEPSRGSVKLRAPDAGTARQWLLRLTGRAL